MARRRTTKRVFPLEIELDMLQWLMPPHNTSKDKFSRPSNFARICKAWQRTVEKSTFHHISLRPASISTFARLVGPDSGRRSYVKHVLLEIPVWESDHEAASFNHSNYIFTQAVSKLWEILSTWHNHSLTVELGVFSSFETVMHQLDPLYSYHVQKGEFACLLSNPSTDHVSRFENTPNYPHSLQVWECHKRSYLGTRALEFEFGEDSSLPNAPVITRLLVRRRYFRNISGKAFSEMFKAAPCLEVIHLERWCYGRTWSDREWDNASSLIGPNLPSSLKRFSFYDEFSTMYHQGRMQIPRSNKQLLRSLTENTWSNQLEHLSISFAFDAKDFFSPRFSHSWASLTTLALTSNLILTRSGEVVNRLLVKVAEAVKQMPRLEMLEIWNCKVRDNVAGIFRYEKLGRTGNIAWQGTWELDMSRQVKQAWQEVLIRSDGGHYELDVKMMSLEPEGLVNLGSICPYLKLRKHVLDSISWTQV